MQIVHILIDMASIVLYIKVESEPRHDRVVGFTRGPQGPFSMPVQFLVDLSLTLLCITQDPTC